MYLKQRKYLLCSNVKRSKGSIDAKTFTAKGLNWSLPVWLSLSFKRTFANFPKCHFMAHWFQLWNLPVTVLAVCKTYLLNKLYRRCKLKMKNCNGLRYKPLCFWFWHLLYNIGDISRAFGRIWTSKNPIFDGVHFMTNLRILL